MRRPEREITDPALIRATFTEADLLYLALPDQPAPYVLPVNFGWEPGRLFVHGAREGRKLELLGRHPEVGFCLTAGARVVPAADACGFSATGRSVVGTGRVRVLDDASERTHALDVILRHYAPDHPGSGYRPSSLAKTLLIEIEILTQSAKRVG
jgi:uncharacterized protein